MTRDNIKKLTSAKMDEVTAFNSTEIIPVSLLDTIMDGEAIAFISECPVHLLPGAAIDTTSHTPNESEGTGYILCPSDFVRLHTFKMTEWSAPVKQVITEDNPLYVSQRYSVLRGGVDKPVVVFRIEPTEISGVSEGYILEYISVVSDHTIETALYIPEMLPEELPERVIDAYTWYLAATALAVSGSDIAQKSAIVAENRYKRLFNIYHK